MRQRHQRTFTIAEHGKVTMVSSMVTRAGNLAGWSVRINGERFFVNTMTHEQAEDRAFVRWVEKQEKAA